MTEERDSRIVGILSLAILSLAPETRSLGPRLEPNHWFLSATFATVVATTSTLPPTPLTAGFLWCPLFHEPSSLVLVSHVAARPIAVSSHLSSMSLTIHALSRPYLDVLNPCTHPFHDFHLPRRCWTSSLYNPSFDSPSSPPHSYSLMESTGIAAPLAAPNSLQQLPKFLWFN
ncbi:hypothetical protein M413DRAFT_32681 [Hebeloma cylindrosporum]|uniref:Uncharacterized protein n=1 Tax=Hebeloma cylindrosporum TaxID=76867 RepID=A0A0C3BV12_HEBCY|nr:hypothetical protein M413DRAFT_32681 [Hebeloma cylindrosporum h7]